MLMTVLVAICVTIAIVRFNLLNTDRVISAAAGYPLALLILLASGIVAIPYVARAVSSVLGADVAATQCGLALALAAIALPAHRRVHAASAPEPRLGMHGDPILTPATRDSRVIADGNVFRKEGEYWTIAFDGSLVRLRNTKGLHYIACLLRQPRHEFHVTELLAVAGDDPRVQPGLPIRAEAMRVSDLGDAGTLLDAKAKAEYKHRLGDLRAELEHAERCNDLGRVARARAESAFISGELSAAVGLGGRDRSVASGAERARVAVTKRIKAALGRIQEANPSLGHHLMGAITTGYFCVYAPNADALNSWLF